MEEKDSKMEDNTNQVLPYIIGYLRERPGQCDTFDNICEDLQNITAEDPNVTQEIVRAALEQSICVGKDLGILASKNGIIRIPFNLQKVENLDAVEDTCPTNQQERKTRNLQPLVKVYKCTENSDSNGIQTASSKPETNTTHLEPEPVPNNFEITIAIKSIGKKLQETYLNPRPVCNVPMPKIRERSHRKSRGGIRRARRRIRSRRDRTYAFTRGRKSRKRSYGRRRRPTRRRR